MRDASMFRSNCWTTVLYHHGSWSRYSGVGRVFRNKLDKDDIPGIMSTMPWKSIHGGTN